MSLNITRTTRKPTLASTKGNMSSVELWQLLTVENPVFCCYLFWTSILVFKMLLMSLLTTIQRFRNQVFPNQEDIFFKEIDVKFDDPKVERVRRAHRNDMENILPYFTMGLLYVCTNPSAKVACNLFRIGSIARIVHSFVYAIYPVRQPARFLAFFITLVITIYMGIIVLNTTKSYI